METGAFSLLRTLIDRKILSAWKWPHADGVPGVEGFVFVFNQNILVNERASSGLRKTGFQKVLLFPP